MNERGRTRIEKRGIAFKHTRFSASSLPFHLPLFSIRQDHDILFALRCRKKRTKKTVLTAPRRARRAPVDTAPSRARRPRPAPPSRARASSSGSRGPAGRPRGRRCPWSLSSRRSEKRRKERTRSMRRKRRRRSPSSTKQPLLLRSSRRRGRGHRAWRACAASSRDRE